MLHFCFFVFLPFLICETAADVQRAAEKSHSRSLAKVPSAVWLPVSSLPLPSLLLSLPTGSRSAAPERGGMSDVNESDVKGLTEMKPGSKKEREKKKRSSVLIHTL